MQVVRLAIPRTAFTWTCPEYVFTRSELSPSTSYSIATMVFYNHARQFFGKYQLHTIAVIHLQYLHHHYRGNAIILYATTLKYDTTSKSPYGKNNSIKISTMQCQSKYGNYVIFHGCRTQEIRKDSMRPHGFRTLLAPYLFALTRIYHHDVSNNVLKLARKSPLQIVLHITDLP